MSNAVPKMSDVVSVQSSDQFLFHRMQSAVRE